MSKSILFTLFLSVVALGIVSCGPSLVIQNVDYSQPLESVISVDSDNMVYDQKYGIRFSVSPILEEEGMTSIDEVHLIRNNAGYYFVAGNGFQNVYVFEPDEKELKLSTKIEFSEEGGLREPAFNQRDSYIELVDRANDQTYQIDQNGKREEATS